MCDFIRHTGRSPDEARDLTQAFFTRVLDKGDFRSARPERGRFRLFLLTAVRHFLANQADHDRAAKRGGGQVHCPIGPEPDGDSRGSPEPACGDTPETVFERRWALTTLDTAMARLAREYEQRGRRQVFESLKGLLTYDEDVAAASCAQMLGLEEASVRVILHRMRRRFGQLVRETLAETVDDPADVDAELDFLLAVVSRPEAGSSLERH